MNKLLETWGLLTFSSIFPIPFNYLWADNVFIVVQLCFFRQFRSSIQKSDYFALRLGFITVGISFLLFQSFPHYRSVWLHKLSNIFLIFFWQWTTLYGLYCTLIFVFFIYLGHTHTCDTLQILLSLFRIW